MLTIDKQVASGPDDGQVENPGTYYSNNGAVLYVGNSSCTWDQSYARFTGISIPKAALIQVAYIQVWGSTYNSHVKCNIYFEKANDPAAVTSYNDYLARSMTTALVPWNGVWGTTGQYDTSPSLVDIIQELVNAYAYSNQAMQVFFRENGSGGYDSVFQSYDGSKPAKLHIEYIVKSKHGWCSK